MLADYYAKRGLTLRTGRGGNMYAVYKKSSAKPRPKKPLTGWEQHTLAFLVSKGYTKEIAERVAYNLPSSTRSKRVALGVTLEEGRKMVASGEGLFLVRLPREYPKIGAMKIK